MERVNELINNALEDIQDYYYKVGLNSKISLVKHIESQEKKGLYLIFFECDMCVSCAMLDSDGDVYVLSEAERTQPSSPDEAENYYWVDTKTKDEVYFLGGIVPIRLD